MRKTILICLSAITILASCGQANSGPKNDNKQSTEATTKAKPIYLTTQEFATKVADLKASEWKYLGDKPAVIDFYADWCPPCKKLAPVLDELANELAGQVIFYKVNVDKEPSLAQAFGIQSIPTLIYIPVNGDPSSSMGFMPKATLKKTIEQKILK